MSDFPVVTIVLITYKRLKEIQRTMDALLLNLKYPRERLRWLIADDSSGNAYITNIKKIARYKELHLEFSVTDTNSGWGANANTAIRRLETDLFFFIEDDYVLTKPLDLMAGVALMEAKPEIGMLRYRGTAGGHFILHHMEADIRALYPEYQDGVGVNGKLTYCLLDSGSPDLYIYTHGASLRRVSFHKFYNLYPEGLKLGATEETYAHIVKDMMRLPDAPTIAILPEWVNMYFDHIGVSYQHSDEDKGAG